MGYCLRTNGKRSPEGQIWLELVRDNEVRQSVKRCLKLKLSKKTHHRHPISQVIDRFEHVSLAPVIGWYKQEVHLKDHPLISNAACGDLIKVTRLVAGYDGLYVRAFRMTLYHKSNEWQKRKP